MSAAVDIITPETTGGSGEPLSLAETVAVSSRLSSQVADCSRLELMLLETL